MSTTTNNQMINEHLANYAVESGKEALEHAKATLLRAMTELDRFSAKYDAADQLKHKADILNWTLNHLATYIPSNVNLHMIAGAQAKLVRADAQLQE